jgi:7-cyano-7-deazaguanine synthase in queuosine biosynthesis
MTRERVLVAMSGGVDSSVAAAMLVEKGYDVIGATMKLFCYGDEVPDRPCCSLDSIDDARRVCERLGVPRELAIAAVRMSLGSLTTAACIERVVQLFPALISKARRLAGAAS